MATADRTHIQQTLANTLGTLGYLSLMLQWAWSFVILFYPFIADRNSFLFRKDMSPAPPVSPIDTPAHPIITIILVAITILILIFTTITLLRAPKAVGKTGAKLTRATSAAILPTLIHHKKISKQRRAALSYQATLVLKLIATLIPLAALLFAPTISAMPGIVIWAIAACCGLGTILYFTLQIVVVKLFNVDKSKVW